MANRGLLLTLTEPPSGMEEEFNAWYDTEHLPERLAIPGFRSARRWVSGKSYLATYELDSPEILTSKAYLEKFNNQTPWSRRCLGKCVVFKRWACEQLGSADPHAQTRAVFLGRVAGALQVREFRSADKEEILISELKTPRPGAFHAYEA